MFYTDYKLQYPVRVDAPDPAFARALQQAIGGVEGEIRVAMQYMFQAWGMRGAGSGRYRELLLNTAAEEMGHIEMLATAVALNLEGAPLELQERAAEDQAVGSVMGGRNFRQYLSAGLAALPVDADGVPFSMSHVYASGNLAADMYANVTAESTGRVLATRLHTMTTDPGMKDMLSYLIARDTMHQQQWLAVLEDRAGATPSCRSPTPFRRRRRSRSTATRSSASPRTAPSRRAGAGRRGPRSTAGVSSRRGRWSPRARSRASPRPRRAPTRRRRS